jgi:transcription antitermination factor NusG
MKVITLMLTSSSFFSRLLLCAVLVPIAFGQDASSPAGKAPLDHVLGTIKSVDQAAHTVTVQEDKTGTEHLIQLANTKTILKVEPTAKDLKSAVRITANDLNVGDRVDVRGTKLDDAPTTMSARSLILMSGRDLAQTHEQQAAAWARATLGRVTAVDPASGAITANVTAAGATTSVTVQTSSSTEFSRYSPDIGKAAPSQMAQIQVGDRLKVIGDKSADGASITAQKVYSGAFRTFPATVSALGSDGKSMTVKDLASKKDVNIALGGDVSIHKLPPMMAGFLARRLNPSAAAAGTGAANGAGHGGAAAPANGGGSGQAGGMPGGAGGPPGAGGPGMTGGRGDISQMIERTPTITLADLKPGDAVVISGVTTGGDNSHVLANTIIAGVEPILQAAPAQRGGGRDVGGDWGLGEMSMPQ